MNHLRTFCFAAATLLGGFAQSQDPVSASADKAKVGDKATSADRTSQGVPAAGVTVGVVDFLKVFEFYPRAIKENERIRELSAQFGKDMDALKKRVDALRDDVALYPEGSLQHRMKQLELEGMIQHSRAMAKVLNEQLQIEQMRMEILLYEDAELAVAKVAERRGVQIVLRKLAMPEREEGEGPADIQNRLVGYERRQVWFAAPEVDLTGDVIKLLQVPLERPKAESPAKAEPAKDAASTKQGDQDQQKQVLQKGKEGL